MTPQRLLRATGLAVFATAALPFGPELGSAAEPDSVPQSASATLGPAQAELYGEEQSRVVLQRPGGPLGDVRSGFVVLTRPDGRVPRAWLWDEPLGCPPPASGQRVQAPSRSASSDNERTLGQSVSP